MNELEAQQCAIRETEFCYVLGCVWDGVACDSICLERIYVKASRYGAGYEGLRLMEWKGGKQLLRPVHVSCEKWLYLFSQAIDKGVFSSAEQFGMLRGLIQKGH